MRSFYHWELGTLLVTNPTWVVKTCLCPQYVITELKEMYSDLNFNWCTFHVHGKCRSGSILENHNLKTLYPANLIQPNLNPLTSKVCLFILLSRGYTFRCKLVRRIWFYLMSLSIIVTFLLDDVEMLQREVTC